MKIYIDEIKRVPLCKNGSERRGVNAICNYSFKKSMKPKIEVSYYGKYWGDAIHKLRQFLSDSGENEIIENL